MKRAFTFPGQGSQYVGMGRSLAEAYPAARELFEEVNDALGADLGRLMFEGPEEKLRLTENTQPALMAVSLAVVRVLEGASITLAETAQFAAGHSLGEYSALAAAGTLGVAETAQLLRLRGQAMQRAVPPGKGAMAALLGLDLEAATEIAGEAAEDGVCEPANDNAPGQVVLSGDKAAVERAIAIARERGARRAVLLPVSAPFHCALMAPAAEEMRDALRDVEFAAPSIPIVVNVRARPVNDPAAFSKLLVEQVTGRVRWRESVEYMVAEGVEQQVELGAGKILSGLARRIERSLEIVNLQDPEDLEAFAATL